MKKPFNQHSQLPEYWVKCPFCGEELKKSGECFHRSPESDYLKVSLYAIGVFLILLALATLVGCGWPEPRFEKIIATKAERDALVSEWRKGTLHIVSHCTGISMEPHIDCKKSTLLQEIYYGQDLFVGDVVVFDRGDIPLVQHTIADMNETSVYMSGDNNRYSDGWFPKSKIRFILRKVIVVENE